MKKIILKSILVMALFFGLMLNINTVKAEDKPTYTTINDIGDTFEFYGTITPRGKFYRGYRINPSTDIIVDGYVKIKYANGYETTSDMIALHGGSIVDDDSDIYNLQMFITADYQFYINDSVIRYESYPVSIELPIPIKREPFSPKLTSNYKDGTMFKFKTPYTWIDGEKTLSMKTIDLKFYNSLGEEIEGKVNFKKVMSSIGVAKCDYTFTPLNVGDLKYDIKKGNVNVEIELNLYVSKRYSNKIVLNYNWELEYKLGENGKWQNSRVFTRLKPNTSYTFYARVKAREKTKASEPVKITVKTLKE